MFVKQDNKEYIVSLYGCKQIPYFLPLHYLPYVF